jgi:NAD(P)-dependent dehydrogenase (short-subunit alcohol dehydrogenase family)
VSLDRKVVLITGAAGGIGSAAARKFAAAGAVVWMADVSEDGLAAVKSDIPGGDVRCIVTDVTKADSVAAAMAEIADTSGGLDILYNNAGGTQPGDAVLTECDDAVFWSTIGVDLFGTWLCCKHAAPLMRKGGGGAIVNTSSMVALVGFAKNPAYSAAKGGVAALTRSLAVAFAPFAIRVNAVAPGITRSPRVQRSVASGRISTVMQDRHLSGFLECEQIAEKAMFLASDAAAGMTGQVLVADAGATIA